MNNKFKVNQVVRCIDSNGMARSGVLYRIDEITLSFHDDMPRYVITNLLTGMRLKNTLGYRETRFEAL